MAAGRNLHLAFSLKATADEVTATNYV